MNKTIAAAAALIAATPAIAQAPQPAKPIARSDYMKTVDARFNAIDSNHDGKITRDEMVVARERDLQQARGRMRQQMEARFRQLDTNHDGQLNLPEFLAAVPSLRTAETPEELLQKMDGNHDGKVTIEEFRAPDIVKFDKVDSNHDGVVTPQEMNAASARK